MFSPIDCRSLTRLLLLAAWSGAVAAMTIFATGRTEHVAAKQMFVTTEMVKTGRQLDLAIAGNGYFMVQDVMAPGGLMYTRYGRFETNDCGQLVITVDGHARVICPPITVPPDATEIRFSRDGQVSYVQPGEATPSIAGAIRLAQFAPGQLQPYEDQLFFVSTDGTAPDLSKRALWGLGSLRQRKLEASMLKLAEAVEAPASDHGQP